jgi:hypothetical protein
VYWARKLSIIYYVCSQEQPLFLDSNNNLMKNLSDYILILGLAFFICNYQTAQATPIDPNGGHKNEQTNIKKQKSKRSYQLKRKAQAPNSPIETTDNLYTITLVGAVLCFVSPIILAIVANAGFLVAGFTISALLIIMLLAIIFSIIGAIGAYRLKRLKKEADFEGHRGIYAKAIALGVLSAIMGLAGIIAAIAFATVYFLAVTLLATFWAVLHFQAAKNSKKQ